MPLPRRLFSRRHAAALIIAVLGGSAVVALPAAAPADPLVATTVAITATTGLVSGQTMFVTATVTPADSSPGEVTGTATFSIDGVVQSPVLPPFTLEPGASPTQVPVFNGIAVAPLVGVAGGTHQLTVAYSGSDLYQANTASVQVVLGPDQSMITILPYTSTNGTLTQVAAAVQGAPPGSGSATGQVQLYLDGAPSGGPATLVADGFWVWVLNLPPGTAHTISVSYLGSADFQPAAQSLYVAPFGSTTYVTTAAGPTSTVVATADVTSLPAGVGTPDGTVTFSLINEQTEIGSPVQLVNGIASSIPVVLPDGDAIEASYSGSTTYRSSVTNTKDTTPPSPPASAGGYWMVSANGTVYGFGGATVLGSAPVPTGQSAVGLASTPGGLGYWIASNRGAVYSFGNAPYLGGNPALAAGEAVTSISATPDGAGYRLFTNKGRVFDYGSAANEGDLSALKLNGPILASETTPSGVGYYMVGSDGGIFSFGDASFWGSMASTKLNGPVNGIVPTSNDGGYWLVASDGGVFSFGDAAGNFLGSMGGHHLNKPIIGMVAYGNGYLMVASDGGIFDFSSSPFAGSLGGNPPSSPIVGVTALP